MSIESAIKDAQEAILEHKSIYLSNEQAVRDTLINPILNELGWNTKSLKFVVPNAPNEDGKIPDYVLLKNGKQMLVVEAKNVSIELSDSKIINQIASYCYNPGIKFGVLTNGEKWLLFNTFQANPSERIVWKLSLLKDGIQDVIRKLSCIAYEYIEQTEQLSSIIHKDELFEETWKNTVQGKESIIDILYQSIQQKMKSDHPSILLNSGNIMNFIDKKLETLFSVKGDEISEEDEGEEDNRNEKNELYMEIKNAESEKFLSHKKSKLRVKIRVIFPDKISIVHNKVADTFVETIKKIGPENVKKLGIYCAGIPIVSDKKDDLYQQRSIPPNFYVMVNSSTSDKLKQLHEINERLKLGIKIEEIIPINDH